MNREIIVVKQLPVIVEQLQTIKEDITRRTNEAMSFVCTEDTVKEIKKVRAELNAEYKQWEDKRKEVKTAIMKPYNDFDVVYKKCITDVFKQADTDLKGKIASVEDELKEKKRNEVIDYFMEYRDSKGRELAEFVVFMDSGINVTLTASLKSLKKQAQEYIDRICDDLKLIETQEHRDEILYEYKQTKNVSSAITTVMERIKALEEAKARAEQTEEQKITATPISEPLAPPIVEESEPVLTTKFTVRGTRAQLKALKEFLDNGGYEYRG